MEEKTALIDDGIDSDHTTTYRQSPGVGLKLSTVLWLSFVQLIIWIATLAYFLHQKKDTVLGYCTRSPSLLIEICLLPSLIYVCSTDPAREAVSYHEVVFKQNETWHTRGELPSDETERAWKELLGR